MQCTLCSGSLPLSQTTVSGLRKHLHICKGVTPAIRAQILEASAAKINQQAATAATAAVAAGVSRKRSSVGSSSGGFQMGLDHYLAGRENALLPAEREAADQHLLRGLVTGGVPFQVSNLFFGTESAQQAACCKIQEAY
jgi:hypothetical protein